MIEKLTPEQERRTADYVQRWTKRLLNPEMNERACISGIKWLYKFSALPEPKVIIVDSPGACIVEAKKYDPDSVDFSSYGNVRDFGWIAKYEYYNEVLGINYDDDSFFKYRDLMKSGIYDCIQLEEVCIVSRMPIVFMIENGVKHNPSGPALKFRDGYEVYYWKGMQVPRHWIMEPEKITEKEIKESNLEVRRSLIDIIGFERWVNHFGSELREIDKTIDNQGHEMVLHGFDFEGQQVLILEVVDPTKLEKYHIWPVQDSKTCWQAKASTFGISEEEMKSVIHET